jgi:VWFA-related protein
MRSRSFRSAVLLLTLLASAQQKPVIPGIGETIEVSLVNVDVFVTNKAGQRVKGLTKDDFDVYENGVKQPITNFSEYSAEPAAATTDTTAGAPVPIPRQPRTIVLFVERFHLPEHSVTPFFAQLKTMLHDTVGPVDKAMIVFWNRGLLTTPQPLTNSLPALDRALDGLAKQSAQKMQDLRADYRFQLEFAQSFDDQAAAGGMSSNGDGIADLERDYLASKEKYDQEKKAEAIKGLMRVVAAAEGKKVFVLVTHRLSRLAGADVYDSATQEKSIYGFNQADKRDAVDMSKFIKSIHDTANANGITMYPLFPEGLEKTVQGQDSSETDPVPILEYQTLNNEIKAISEIAEETGGLMAWGNDTVKLIPKVAEDLDTYYSIAYRVRTTGVDKGRKIEVRPKNASLVVRTRRAFVEKSDQTRMEDRVIAALFNNPPSPGFGLKIDVGRLSRQGSRTIIPLRIHIPLAVMTQLPEGSHHTGAYSVYFAWGGSIGGIGDTKHFTKTYTVPSSEIEKARASGAYTTFEETLSVDKNTDRVAFGVLDEVGKDYALRLMAVPKPKR